MKHKPPTGKTLLTAVLLLLLVAVVIVWLLTNPPAIQLFFAYMLLLLITLLHCLLLIRQEKWLLATGGRETASIQFPQVVNTVRYEGTGTEGRDAGLEQKRFRALVENNEDIIALTDEKGHFLFRSASADRITGWSNREFEKIPLSNLHPDDAATVKASIAGILKKKGQTVTITTRLRHKRGHYIWLHGTITNCLDDPDIAGIVINLRDITLQREAEEKITSTNRLYLFISHVNKVIVKVRDEYSLFKEVCRIAVEIGKFRMAWVGMIDDVTKKLLPVTHAGEEADYLSKIYISSVSEVAEGRGPTGTALRKGEYIFCNNIEQSPEMAPWKEAAIGRGYRSSISLPIKKAGNVIGAFTLYAPLINFFNPQEIELLEEVTGDISFALDIFEKEKMREMAAEELLQSKQRYQTLTEVAPAGIFHTDPAGFTTYVNPRWCQISGMTPEQAMGNGWMNGVHKEDKDNLIEGWQEATRTSHLSFSEYRFVRPDGSIAWVLGQAIPEYNREGRVIGYVGTATDITERKEVQEKIEKIYREKETVLNRINDAMVSVDNEWHYTFLNDAALATHPLGREESMGKSLWDVHPEMKGTAFWDKYHDAMETKKVVEFENFYTPMNTWFSVKVYPSRDGLTIFYRDITERKKNELRLHKAQEIGKLGYWQLDLKTNMVWASKEARRIYGFPLREGALTREEITACIIDKEVSAAAITNLVNYNKAYNIELRINPADGTAVKYIAAQAELERTENGLPLRVDGTLQDITERVKAANEIIKEKSLSDSIINSLPGIFYLYSKAGKFLRWNKNFQEISGYGAEEISQMHPLDFFTPAEKDLLAKKIANTFFSGEDNVQADFLLKTKATIPYYFTGRAIEYEGTACLVGVGIDFTERKKAQEKINETTEQLRQLTAHLQSIREEERKRIGREIHDELGQQLTAIKMDIAWIDKKIPEEASLLKTKLKNVITLLDGSNQSIRRILSELRPAILDDHGLVEAMEWIGRQLAVNTTTTVHFTSNQENIVLCEPIATCIFRVYQEALNNIIRHAGARAVNASLQLTDQTVTVCIEDDGKGFAPAAIKTNKSFGLLGMKERILSLQGSFELVTAPGKGTKIIIQLPCFI